MLRNLCGGGEKFRPKVNLRRKGSSAFADNQLCSRDLEHYRAGRTRSARWLIETPFNLSARNLSPTVHVITGRLKKSCGANNVKEKQSGRRTSRTNRMLSERCANMFSVTFSPLRKIAHEAKFF